MSLPPLCRRYGVDLISMIGAYVKRMKDAVRG